MDDHSSAASVTRAVKLPTRALWAEASPRRSPAEPCGAVDPNLSAKGPYSALLRVGLAIPSRLPGPWWALTPPFHPHLGFAPEKVRHQGSLFSVALSLGLPPPGVTRHPYFMESGLSSKVAPRGHPAIRARAGIGARRGVVNGDGRASVVDIRPKPRHGGQVLAKRGTGWILSFTVW